MEIRGRVAVVSGGASGLGEAAVRALAAQGASVVIADLNEARGEALAAELGGSTRFVKTDVSVADQVGRAMDAAAELGSLRAVVSCAGLGAVMRTLDKAGKPHDPAVFERVLSVNLFGTFHMLRLGAAQLAKNEPDAQQARGVIVNTASIAAFDGQVGQLAYSASKGAIVGMTLPAARDLGKLGIRVCTVCPGTMDTPLLAGLPEAARKTLAESIPFPSRLGLASEFAKLVLHVLDNDYLNGETIRLDGALRMPFR
jgi:NAD(P)-dependent dehydrogenase (short-subunit alcohol dehydrogenase family)